jgi:hypothetical protein
MFKRIIVVDQNQFAECEIKESGSKIENEEDVVSLDVPLMIRMLEYAREDAKNDLDLHNVVTKMLDLGEKGDTLTMKHYTDIVGKSSVMTEETMLFRMNSRTLWSRFAWSLLNYSIALNSEIDGTEQAEKRIYSHAAKLGEFVKPYYGDETGRVLGEALTTFGKIGVTVMQDLKAGKPLDGTKTLWDINVDEISTFLSTINPMYWPKAPVKSYFDMLVKFWIDSIKARNAKDWAANEIAIDNIDKLITVGNGESDSLADVFSAGVIAQYPEKFAS